MSWKSQTTSPGQAGRAPDRQFWGVTWKTHDCGESKRSRAVMLFADASSLCW